MQQVAMEHIHAGGYVCQGQKILQATAEYKLDLETRKKLATHAKATVEDVNKTMKRAIEAQTGQEVEERSGRLLAGSALKYGVAMNPVCLAPPDGRFRRVLPQTTFRRAVNFVLFRIIEPLLPAKVEQPQVARTAVLAQAQND